MDGILKSLRNAFGNSEIGYKPGGIIGTLVMALVGAAVAYFTGGGLGGMAIGALAGGIGGTMFSDSFNKLAGSFSESGQPQRRKHEVAPDVNINQEVKLSLEQPGKLQSAESVVPVPNIERLTKSAAMVKSSEQIIEERENINLLAPEEVEGARKRLRQIETESSRLGSNIEDLNAVANKFNSEKRPQLVDAYKASKAAIGKELSPEELVQAVPAMPVIDLKIDDLTPGLREYATNMYVAANKDKTPLDFDKDYPTPLKRVTYVFSELYDRTTATEPNWEKGWLKEQSTSNYIMANGTLKNNVIAVKKALEEEKYSAAVLSTRHALEFVEDKENKIPPDDKATAKANLNKLLTYAMAKEKLKEVETLDHQAYDALYAAKDDAIKQYTTFAQGIQKLEKDTVDNNKKVTEQKAKASKPLPNNEFVNKPAGQKVTAVDRDALQKAVGGVLPYGEASPEEYLSKVNTPALSKTDKKQNPLGKDSPVVG